MSTFRERHTFEQRKAEATRIRAKYPDRIPVIVEMSKKSTLPPLDKCKFLVPNDLTVGQLVYTIRKRIKLTPETAIFIFVNETLPPTSMFMSQLYETSKASDGFLFVTVSGESVFG